jgi:UDP-N-acetylglucosamine/UDP-N-acetylgalactosamine 4-epimerase
MYDKKFHTEDLSKFTFLVTGGAGFIGSHLVEYLLKYNAGKVKVLDNLSTGYAKNLETFAKNPSFEFVHGNIRDIDTCRDACKGINIVFHEAALGSVPRSIKDPIATNNSNVVGYLNMLVAAKEHKVEKFIYASSSSVYGDSPILPKAEDQLGKPLSPYAATKLMNELYADVFSKTYGMKIIGFRYFNVFGPRQNTKGAYAAVIPLFINSFINKTSPKIDGDGEQTRDFTFVSNVVRANINAAFTNNAEAFNQVYNMAVGDRTSLNVLVKMLKEISGNNIDVIHGDSRPGDVHDSLADISKAKKLLGYGPEVRIREGLEITLDWFKKNQAFINKE